MKHFLLTSAFVLVCIFSVSTLKAQTVLSVEVDSLTWISPASGNFNDSIYYNVRLRNTSGPDFSDEIDFLRTVNGGTIDTIKRTLLVNIPAGDTMSFILRDKADASRFGGGINIVVVWPAAPNIIVGDSAKGEYEIVIVGIGDPAIDQYPMKLFPNPVTNTLRFQYDFQKSEVSTLRLSDQQGRILRSVEGLPNSLDLMDLPSGVYILEVGFRDGLRRRFKLMVRH